jgi:hypothetical protein
MSEGPRGAERSGAATDSRSVEVLTTEWNALAPHHQRGALFVLADEVELRDAAEAIAEDRKAEVEALVASGRLRRPTPEEVERWAAAPEAHGFRFAIVQPYIVAQRLGA